MFRESKLAPQILQAVLHYNGLMSYLRKMSNPLKLHRLLREPVQMLELKGLPHQVMLLVVVSVQENHFRSLLKDSIKRNTRSRDNKEECLKKNRQN